jgi:hypothetical protein
MSGAISSIAGPAYGRFAKITGMTAKAALIDASCGRPVKRQAPVFQIIYRSNGLFCQYFGRLLN